MKRKIEKERCQRPSPFFFSFSREEKKGRKKETNKFLFCFNSFFFLPFPFSFLFGKEKKGGKGEGIDWEIYRFPLSSFPWRWTPRRKRKTKDTSRKTEKYEIDYEIIFFLSLMRSVFPAGTNGQPAGRPLGRRSSVGLGWSQFVTWGKRSTRDPR